MGKVCKKGNTDQAEIVQANQAIRKTGRGGKYNFPQCIPPEDANDVRQALSAVLQWHEIGKTRPANDEEWEARTDDYFRICMETGQRPTWEKYCLCMGYPRQMIWDFMNGNRNASRACSDSIKRAKDYCAAYDAEMVVQGKLRDTPYIFRAKNFYAMRDEQEITITPNAGLADVSPADIVQKYDELPD